MQAATKFLALTGLGVAITLLVGCGRAPEPLSKVVQQTPREIPADPVQLSEDTLTTTPESTPVEAATPQPAAQFKNPQVQAAVSDYQTKWQQLQDDREAAENLGQIDPLVNPQAITDYANQIGNHANQLDQAERAAKELMEPNEKKRFKQLQKQLTEEQEEQ